MTINSKSIINSKSMIKETFSDNHVKSFMVKSFAAELDSKKSDRIDNFFKKHATLLTEQGTPTKEITAKALFLDIRGLTEHIEKKPEDWFKLPYEAKVGMYSSYLNEFLSSGNKDNKNFKIM